MATCRDCRLYDLDAVRNVRGSIMRNRVARCLWKSKETWPASVQVSLNSRPTTSWMRPEDGDRCPCFQKRTAKASPQEKADG